MSVVVSTAKLLKTLNLRAAQTPKRFLIAINLLTAAGVVASGMLLTNFPVGVIFVAAVMFGCSEADGFCGLSHVGSLTPFRALGRHVWTKAMVAYTLGGTLTACFVGACLALIGRALEIRPVLGAAIVVPLSLGLASREFGWIQFPLPQVRRQTNKMWAARFGFVTGPAMWGAHIGLAFFTVVNHGGFYIVAAVALTLGPMLAALLFIVYWFGRTLPIWTIPLLTTEHKNGVRLSRLVRDQEAAFRNLAAVGLLCTACAGAIIAASAQTIAR